MKKLPVRTIALAVAFIMLALTTAAARISPSDTAPKKPTITVYKDPSCGCCKKWIEHLVKHGYRVDAKDTPNMTEIKRTLGVPNALTACHTAVVNGYLIEGHVPAADIDRLLEQKPRIAGLAVPGMPAGSPGMEGMGTQRYQVLTFDKSGKTKVFASH
ncbi:MAG TPA: DUF411 domain-containing protein [Gemmatimonadaceae bacterium]|jgi:hypothetical protein|nr:DUF411 domain-containing protein [Gemmatimonadaceae bacterium]